MFPILHVLIVPDVHLPMWKPSAHLSMQLCANHLRLPIEHIVFLMFKKSCSHDLYDDHSNSKNFNHLINCRSWRQLDWHKWNTSFICFHVVQHWARGSTFCRSCTRTFSVNNNYQVREALRIFLHTFKDNQLSKISIFIILPEGRID